MKHDTGVYLSVVRVSVLPNFVRPTRVLFPPYIIRCSLYADIAKMWVVGRRVIVKNLNDIFNRLGIRSDFFPVPCTTFFALEVPVPLFTLPERSGQTERRFVRRNARIMNNANGKGCRESRAET